MCDKTASVEKLLSVPLEFIVMRAVPYNSTPDTADEQQQQQQQQQRPLLLRSEAWSLIQVNLLSYEIDKLIQLSIESLSKIHDCFQYGEELVVEKNRRRKAYHYKLIALLPLLGSIKKCCMESVEYVTNEISLIMGKLETLQVSLRQFSEQNLSIAEQLEEMMTMTGNTSMENQVIVSEKNSVGKIELEVCSRIEMLIETMNTVSVSQTPNADNSQQVCDLIFEELFDNATFVSMAEFCANSSTNFVKKRKSASSVELHQSLIQATQPPSTSDLCLSPTTPTRNNPVYTESPIYDISKKRRKLEEQPSSSTSTSNVTLTKPVASSTVSVSSTETVANCLVSLADTQRR